MRAVFTLGGVFAVAMAIGAGLNTQAWECAISDQLFDQVEHWGPGVALPAVVGAALVLRARKPIAGTDIALFVVSLPLDVYAGITWVASVCSIG